MPADRRHSPIVTHGKFTPRPKEIARQRAHRMFCAWASGRSYEEIAAVSVGAKTKPATVLEVRKIVKDHLKELWRVYSKWQRAEVRCHALAMELRLLRLGKEAPPDQPIESLEPPEFWLRAFRGAGIETVNQLRAMDAEMLLANWRFPRGAIDWACMKLEKLGLSHALRRPEHVRLSLNPPLGKRIIR